MKNKNLMLFLTLLLFCLPLVAQSKIITEIESYGIYVAVAKGFVKVKQYDHIGNYVDFKYLNEIPSAIRENEKLKLIVFKKDFKENSITFSLRPIQTTIEVRDVRFDVKPLKTKDMYELTLDKPVPAGTMLQVYDGYFWNANMGAIVLGDTEKELVKYFSRTDLVKAYAVKAYIEDSLKAYPNNKELKNLSSRWNKLAKLEKAARDYTYVQKSWKKYKNTPKIKLQVRYLKKMLGSINVYLRDHENGANSVEAKDRKLFALKKIEELQKQI